MGVHFEWLRKKRDTTAVLIYRKRTSLLFYLQLIPLHKETLIKSNNFRLAKSAAIIPEDPRNRMTITAYFMNNSDIFFCA